MDFGCHYCGVPSLAKTGGPTPILCWLSLFVSLSATFALSRYSGFSINTLFNVGWSLVSVVVDGRDCGCRRRAGHIEEGLARQDAAMKAMK